MPRPTKYEIINRQIRQHITAGKLAPGDRLPSEAELCDSYALSRGCVRRALAELKQEGIIESRRGKGYYVREARITWEDTCLTMQMDFGRWNPAAPNCKFYGMLEQDLSQHRRQLVHLQPADYADPTELLSRLAQTRLNRIIIEYRNETVNGHYHRFAAQLRHYPARIVMTTFCEPRMAPPCDTVYPDWIGGTHGAVRHLTRQHAGSIFFAGYPGKHWSDVRHAAFLAAMNDAGRWTPGEPEPCFNCQPFPGHTGTGEEMVSAAADRLAAHLREHPVEALLCAHDALIQQLALRIPLAELPTLVGYDNSLWSIERGISSIEIDMRKHIDTLLVQLMQPESLTVSLIPIPPHLIKRHLRA